jgi:hypothetical protein
MATTVLPKGYAFHLMSHGIKRLLTHNTPHTRPEREHRNVEKELKELTAKFVGKETALAVPLNFAMTVEPHFSSVDPRTERPTCTAHTRPIFDVCRPSPLISCPV